ncbi:MAG: chorismate-binding protein [Verrucomicrobia bacterium]|nr:chorismate-binding protein [Verrucomicrobiota bacterium]
MPTTSASMAWLARPDGTVVVGHGPFESAVSAPNGTTAFYVQDFTLTDPTPWKIPARVETMTPGEFAARHERITQPVCRWDAPDATPFSAVFQEIMAAMHVGLFEKTVPVVVEMGEAASPPGPGLAAAMARQSAPLMSYGFVGRDNGFAGATPELLISYQDRGLQTMALAGTARHDDRDVFGVDDKEIREHEYVAQTLVSKLTDLGTLRRHPRTILDLGSIVHFLTFIDVGLDTPACPEALLKRLHPTPALGPLPRTVETLAKLLEWRDRLHCPPEFGAPFGVAHQDRFDAVVAIRGIWWQDRQLALPAGCGIIEASRLVNEWRELRLKRESVKRFLEREPSTI